MLLGSVVGIGIFFKNGSVFDATKGDGVTSLLAWVIGGLISLAAALSFSEIGSLKTKNVRGLSAWTEITLGKKAGYFVRFVYPFFYYGILITALGTFSAEAALQFLVKTGAISNQPHIGYVILIGFAVSFLTVTTNLLSIRLSGKVQFVTTVLKFIPLLVALVIGIVLPGTHNNADGKNNFETVHFSISALIAALPAVLFAYDAFLDVGSLSGKIEGGEKTVGKVVFVGLLSTIVLYSLIAISSLLHNAGWIEDLLKDTLPAGAGTKKGIEITVWAFITVSAYGVANGVTAGGVANFEQSVATNTFVGAKTLNKKIGNFWTTVVYISICFVFWGTITFVPALIQNSDRVIDGVTNYPTLFFFAIYGAVIFAYLLKRSKYETKKINNIIFKVASITAIVGIALILGWQFFYTQTIAVFNAPHSDVSWGFFHGGPKHYQNWQQFAIFASFLFIFFTFPFINKWATKKFENNEVIIGTQSLNLEQ